MQNQRYQANANGSQLEGWPTQVRHQVGQARCASAQVVIIGAGLAGLAAAQRLHELGIDEVVILDALDRVGGRVHTITHSNYLLEMGAQWLHGADDNPLHQWLTSMDMLDDFQDASLGFQGIYCTSSTGAEISPDLVKRVLDVVCESKLALSKDGTYLTRLATVGGKRCPVNAAKRLKNASQVFKTHLDMQLDEDEELARNKKLVYAIFDWFLRYETIENCCDSMDEVSIQSYTDWTDLGEGTLLNFKDGYRSLLQWFCKHFPQKHWLQLNQHVLNVELMKPKINQDRSNSMHWIDTKGRIYESPILVHYKPVNKQGVKKDIMTIACKHVIVTSSLGFLKKNMHTFFTPELPPGKQELIRSVGFGTVNKIILQFENSFWDQSGGIKLVWQDADFIGKHSFPYWCRDILAFDVVRRQPNLLIGWIGGKGAKSMECESDEDIGRICIRILDKFLPELHEKPTTLLSCICSRWHSNSFTCGSYSFQSMDSLGMNVDKLQEPLYSQPDSQYSEHSSQLRSKNYQSSSSNSKIPRILFAGEATAGKLYSTAHGAIISGWREADRLYDYLSASKQTGHVVSTKNGPAGSANRPG